MSHLYMLSINMTTAQQLRNTKMTNIKLHGDLQIKQLDIDNLKMFTERFIQCQQQQNLEKV